jgi:energy-converting hydrogenase Eha subunit H
MNQLQLPDLTTFLTCLSVFVPLFGGAGIVLGALGWLSDRITIGGPRTR